MLPDADLLRTLHTRARAAAATFRLPFRQQRWRGQSGEFQGSGVGSSLEFQDHRAYIPGDDPRQINWQAYARTGSYTMKQYREEVRPIIDLMFDVSASMDAFAEKGQRATELFLWAVESALQAGASLKVFFLHHEHFTHIPEELVLSRRWITEAEKLREKSPTTLSKDEEGHDLKATAALPGLMRVPLRAGAMRLLISDLLFAGAPDSAVAQLSARSGRGLIFAPTCRQESDPQWDGNYEFLDPETGHKPQHRIDEGILKTYLSAYRRHFDLWKGSAIKHNVLVARIPAEPALESALQAEAVMLGAVEY